MWCEFFCNYERIWIASSHFGTWVWQFHTTSEFFHKCVRLLVARFCGWDWWFHNWTVNFLTSVNGSGLELCIFMVRSDGFTPGVQLFSHVWTAWIGCLYLCIWVWRIHTFDANVFTTVNGFGSEVCILFMGLTSSLTLVVWIFPLYVNNSWLEVYIFVDGSNGFTPTVWIFVQE